MPKLTPACVTLFLFTPHHYSNCFLKVELARKKIIIKSVVKYMDAKRTLYLKDLLILTFVLIMVAGVGYKYLEWSVFNKLAKLHNSSIANELSIIERGGSLEKDVADEILKLDDTKSIPESRLKIYDQLEGKINLVLDNNKSYLEEVKSNFDKFKKLNFASKLLVGERGKLARRILSDQLNYYEKEREAAYDNIVSDYLLKNIFAVIKDKDIIQIYDEKASVSPEKLYPKYFSEIASLEKYTRSDFKFPEEDAIKESYSYGYETLQNYKNYIGMYYATVKDFVAGDYESASYKYSKLKDQAIKLNVDVDRLFGENQSVGQESSKQIIELVVDKVTAIKEYKNKNFGKYPLLPNIEGWKEDLEMCQIYNVKGLLISNISKQPIDANDATTYLDWLSKNNPSTSLVDNLVDKSIIKFTNSEDKLIYQCLDKETGKEYTFITPK